MSIIYIIYSFTSISKKSYLHEGILSLFLSLFALNMAIIYVGGPISTHTVSLNISYRQRTRCACEWGFPTANVDSSSRRLF